MLRWPIGLSREEAAIYCAWSLGTALISFGRRGNDIVAHLLPKHPRLPAKRFPVELRHALAVVVGHFEVYDRVHFAHDCPPCRLSDTTLQGDLSGILQLRCGFAPGHLASIRIETHRHPPHIAPKIVVSLGRSTERRFE